MSNDEQQKEATDVADQEHVDSFFDEETTQTPEDDVVPEAVEEDAEQVEEADPDVVEGNSTAVARIRTKRKPARKKRPGRIDRQVMEFQPDVVELEHRKTPLGARWTLYAVLLLITSGVIWACWAKIDRQVKAEGELIPVEPAVLIQPIETAKILKLHAEFDDVVAPGQAMVTLDPTYSEAEVAKLTKQKVGFEALVARLEAELNGDENFDNFCMLSLMMSSHLARPW